MKWNSLLKAGGRANHEIISSFSWIGGLWPLPAAGAPPRRENKEEMIEWVSEPPKKESEINKPAVNSIGMEKNEVLWNGNWMGRLVWLIERGPKAFHAAASQPITPINSPNQLVCWWRLIELECFVFLSLMCCSLPSLLYQLRQLGPAID